MSLTVIKAVGVFALLGYLVLLLPVLRSAATGKSFLCAVFRCDIDLAGGGDRCKFLYRSWSHTWLVSRDRYPWRGISLLFAQSPREFLGVGTRRWIIQFGYPIFGIMALWVLLGGSRSSQASLILLYRVSGCRNSGPSRTGTCCSAISI